MTKTQKRLILTAVLTIFFLVTRLSNLTKIPIFTDEAIYIRWGQIALQDPAHRFISLEDGKQPLFIWLMIPALKFISDPLVAGRIISVAAGFISLAATVAIGWILFGETTAVLAGAAYIVSPFFLLYDRLALYDSLTAALMAVCLLLSILLAKKPRLDLSLLLGATIGLGLLTKSSAQFAIFLLPVSLVLFDWKSDQKVRRLAIWIIFSLISISISILMSTLLRLSPLGYMVKLKEQTFIVSFDEFFTDPFSRIWGNLGGLTHWFIGYLTWPWIISLIAVIIFSLKKCWRQTLLLLAWFIVPYLALAAFGIVLYPRFLLFMALPLLPLIAGGITTITSLRVTRLGGKRDNLTLWSLAMTVIVLSYPTYISYQLITSPLDAPIPQADRGQLMDDWPAGYGIPEVVEILKKESQAHKIFIGTEGTFGLTPYALNIYLRDDPKIEIKGYWPIGNGIPEIIEIARSGKPTFVLFKDTQTPNPEWPLALVEKYRKGRSNVFMSLYQVTPK